MSPAVLVMGIIIVLSFCIVVAVMYYGVKTEGDFHGGAAESAGVSYWQKRAERLAARQQQAAAGVVTATAGEGADDAEAEKARKRAEALARKAARAAKPDA